MCVEFEELVGAPVALLSTSSERDDTILCMIHSRTKGPLREIAWEAVERTLHG